MRKLLVILVLVAAGIGVQGQEFKKSDGTKLTLAVPDDFENSSEFIGFTSRKDHSNIMIQEMDLPYTHSDNVDKRVSSIVRNGWEVLVRIDTVYNGSSATHIEYFDPIEKKFCFILMTGSNHYQLNIQAVYPLERKDEILGVIYNGVYDRSISINSTLARGFTVTATIEGLHEVANNSSSINYEQRDSLNQIVTYLGLNKSAKLMLSNFNTRRAVHQIILNYFPNGVTQEQIKLVVDGKKGYCITLRTSKGIFSEFNIVAVIPDKDFNIIAIGGTTSLLKMNDLKALINSVKFLNAIIENK